VFGTRLCRVYAVPGGTREGVCLMYVNDELRAVIERMVKAELLLCAVLENVEMDRYEEPCKVNITKYNEYLKAIHILESLQENGKCEFEAADIREQYILHTINVKWTLLQESWFCIDSSIKQQVIELLKCTDECLMDEDEAGTWQFSSRIYVPIQKDEN
jgi:hypothetical protein